MNAVRLPSLSGRDVIRGLVAKILRDVGMTSDEFEALL